MLNHSEYQHPTNGRYKVPALSHIFSEYHKRVIWRRVWFALAKAQCPDLVSTKELGIIEKHCGDISINESLEVEMATKHDLVSELRVFQNQCGDAGYKLHLGATSSDITENANHLILAEAVGILINKAEYLKYIIENQATKAIGKVCMGRTHLQLADASLWEYRFFAWQEELRQIIIDLGLYGRSIRSKGFKGSVGNRMAYAIAYKIKTGCPWEDAHAKANNMDKLACFYLCLNYQDASTQIPFRHDEYMLLACLSSLAAWCHKVGQDFRLLHGLGEVLTIRDPNYVGSSAMPWKNNPIEAEKACSLSRIIPAMLQVHWENRANSWLERSLDDSANSRSLWPDVFINLHTAIDALCTTIGNADPIDLDSILPTRQLCEVVLKIDPTMTNAEAEKIYKEALSTLPHLG